MKPAPFDHSLIRSLREKLGLSREALVFKLREIDFEITTKTLFFWETGETSPDADDLPKLAQVLGAKVSDFYKGNNVKAN